MLENWCIAAIVFVTSLLLTWQLCRPKSRWRVLDHPNERSLHDAPVPRTGGLAILVSLGVGLLLEFGWAWFVGRSTAMRGELSLWVLGMLFLISVVSFWDDWKKLPAAFRFVVHGVSAAGVVFGAGLTIDVLAMPVIGAVSLGRLAIPLTVLFLMWMTNLYNFMDGMDGFAGGMTVVGFGFLSYLGWSGGHSFIAMISLLTAGAALGFLIFNKPVAKIFMGDVGSTAIGFLAGSLAVHGVHQRLFDFWVPVLVFSPFIVDASVTLLRRLVRGERVWQPHRQHYYQRLVLLGWSHGKTVAAEYALMISCGLSAVVYRLAGESTRVSLLLAWALIYSLLALCVRLAEQRKKLQEAKLAV